MDKVEFSELFAHAPMSIWEEDFSAVGEWLASLRKQGIEDLSAFLESNPQLLQEALSLVRLIWVNEITLQMWEVQSKKELLEQWTELFTDETFEVFMVELLAIWEGRNQLTHRCSARTLTGRRIHYDLLWVAPMVDGEMDLSQVMVAIVDITEHLRIQEALAENVDLARRLTRRLLEVQERERLQLARELHDEFGQLLSTIALQVSMAERKAAAPVNTYLRNATGLLTHAVEQVRNLALELRPAMLDVLGLDAALRWLGERHQQRTGIKTVMIGRLEDVSDEVAIACFRVVQEALTNITRHARAKHIWIEMNPAETQLQIVVRDDGVGFEVNESHNKNANGIHLGLLGMAERIEHIGGQLSLESHPGRGTCVQISVPAAKPASGERV